MYIVRPRNWLGAIERNHLSLALVALSEVNPRIPLTKGQ